MNAGPPPRVALVTGAGRGIGAATARTLVADGFAVGFLGRDRRRLEQVAAGCPGAVVTPADVTDPEAVRSAVDHVVATLGPVGLLVNNAGRIDPEEVPLAAADLAAVWSVIETNLRGPLLVTAAVLPGMLAAGSGRVVNVNSGFAYRRSATYTGYALSKGALARLTDSLAAAYAGAGVRIFDVSPGAVETEMTADMPMFAGKTDWTDLRRFLAVVSAIAAGRLDALSGRFLHAGHDDVDALLDAAPRIVAADARVVALRPYGPDDPLAGT
ncbi:MAG: SDR family oxidoreductase [Actinomycetota bacterium]|nr:SDR family oxidoreductase [Actinomycetota bacterium]